jgi:uncharacterized protein YkwD
MRAKTFVTSLTTTLIVAAVASVWAVTSPLSASCASALEGATAAPAESSAFVSKINALRASKGLAAVTVDSNLSGIAQDWAQHMADQGALAHRPNLAAGVTIDWKLLGENVGQAPDVDQMMNAFVNSPAHYKNLVEGSFTRIGVGTVRTADGQLFSAHEFASVRSAAPAPAPAPAPAVAPSPKPAPARVVPQNSAPVITAAPATTSTVVTTAPATVTTEAPVTIEHAAPATHATPAAKAHTGC